jgi:predicted transcriptional regulator
MTTLPVRTTSVITGDGSVAVRQRLHVLCPTRRGSIDLDVCRACPRLQAASDRVVECTPVVATPDADMPVGSIAPAQVTLVRAEVPVAALESLVPSELLVPVVDQAGRFLGFFAASHVAGAGVPLPPRLARAMPVGARSFGSSLLVHEGTPWPQAVRFMARRHGRVLAITDESGVVRSVLTDLDALRAVAKAGPAHPWRAQHE